MKLSSYCDRRSAFVPRSGRWRPTIQTSVTYTRIRDFRSSSSLSGRSDPVQHAHVRDRLRHRDGEGPVMKHAVGERLEHELIRVVLVTRVEGPGPSQHGVARDHGQLLHL